LGIGVSARTFQSTGIETDIVEIDPVVFKYAQEYFALPQPSNVYITDGRQFVENLATPHVYDYVLHDVFTGGIVFPALFSLESLTSILRALKPNGILAMNFVGHRDSFATHTVHATLKSKFSYVLCFPEEPDSNDFQNIVFYASMSEIRFDFSSIPMIDDPSYYQVLDMFRARDGSSCDHYPKVEPISDARNPLSQLQYQSAVEHWHVVRKVLPDPELWTDYF
jgi:hypothetical protein